MYTKSLAFVAALTATPLAAGFLDLRRGLTVTPVTSAVFEVTHRYEDSPRAYWCGAGEFARTRLGAATRDRVYLVSGRQPSTARPGATAIRFTVSPQAAGIAAGAAGISLSTSRVGANMRVGQAQTFCEQPSSRD